jgi:hypothetical protein
MWNVTKCDYFVLIKDYSVNSSFSLISILNYSTEIQCIGKCHSNSSCLTVIFKTQLLIKNCFFYGKLFNSSERAPLNNSNMYVRMHKTNIQKSSSVFSKTTTKALNTTFLNEFINVEKNNNSLLNVFKNFKLKSILNNTGNSFNWFRNSSSGNSTLYLMDYSSNKILIFDENWVYLSKTTFNSPAYMVISGYYLYISTDTKIFKTDQYLNTLAQYNGSAASMYRGIYYNSIDDMIYVANYAKSRIEVLDTNLNLFDTINLSYKPFSIKGLNNKILVGDSTNGVLLTIENKLITDVFDACNGENSLVSSIILDQFGYMATSCFNSYSYLYLTNGTFTGLTIPTQAYPYQINFDQNGKFIIISDFKISIYN